MKKLSNAAFFLGLMLACADILASDLQSTISPGDIVSSDLLSERFSEAAKTNSQLKTEDLIGNWGVNQSVCIGGAASGEGLGLCDGNVVLQGLVNNGNFFLNRTDVWEIGALSGSESRVSIKSEGFNFLFNPIFGYLVPNDPVLWTCELAGGEVIICLAPEDNLSYGTSSGCPSDSCRLHVMMSAHRYSNDLISLNLGPLDTNILNADGNKFGLFNVLELRRQGLVAVPAFVEVSVSLEKATVSWTFAAEQDAQFEVFRKDSLNGEYKSVAVVSSLQYEDGGLVPGDYWYRVYAVSGGNRSKGSNVRKALID